MRFPASRPSPALVISIIALFVAMGGTSYAAIKITGKNVKNSSLTGKDVKNSSLTGSDVKNNSLTGSDVKESKLGEVPSATSADKATIATSATAAGNGVKAYGTVNSAGAVIPEQSKGITATKTGTGIYCVKSTSAELTSATHPIVATPDYQNGGGTVHILQYGSTGTCVNAGGWEIRTKNQTPATTPATDIRFSLIIP